MGVSTTAWVVTLVVLVAFLFFDVFVIGRRPHEPSMKECGFFIGFYVIAALAFACLVWYHWGHNYASEFVTGWLTEYSLSIDNLFVFLIIMSKLKVPRQLQQFALMVGIILALIFRGAFIALGAALIDRFAWIFFLFGAFLVYTAVGLVRDYRQGDHGEEDADNAVVRLVKKHFHFSDEYHGTKLRIRRDDAYAQAVGGGDAVADPSLGKSMAKQARHLMTPMFLVVIALGSADILFALDSIPAIFGITQEPYLVFAATVFALMGLRQLYFLIGNMLRKLVYLSIGLSVILAFIGVKLLLHALHHYNVVSFEVNTELSLLVIVVTLIITTIASLIKSAHTRAQQASDE